MKCIIKEGELNIRNTAQYSTIQIVEYEVLGFLYWINTLIVSPRKKKKINGNHFMGISDFLLSLSL